MNQFTLWLGQELLLGAPQLDQKCCTRFDYRSNSRFRSAPHSIL